jgi:hypothetical protein
MINSGDGEQYLLILGVDRPSNDKGKTQDLIPLGDPLPMALIKCKKCGQQISSKADKCPHCDAPLKKIPFTAWVVPIIVILAAIEMIAVYKTTITIPSKESSTSGKPARTSVARIANIDKSEKMQEQRKEKIAKLIKNGVFQKVEVSDGIPHVWVSPGFYALRPSTEAEVISVVYAYYFDGTNASDSVRVIDGFSRELVGSFAPLTGLKMK